MKIKAAFTQRDGVNVAAYMNFPYLDINIYIYLYYALNQMSYSSPANALAKDRCHIEREPWRTLLKQLSEYMLDLQYF